MMRDLTAEREKLERRLTSLEFDIGDARLVAVWAASEMQRTPGWRLFRLRYLEGVWRRERDQAEYLERVARRLRAAP